MIRFLSALVSPRACFVMIASGVVAMLGVCAGPLMEMIYG
jgi:hypothetical protein